jgi:16S rRNA (guanine966-N2)-methyltransferase
MLRIISGRYKGRKLREPPADGVRPTIERIREAVFNSLTHGLITEGGAGFDGLNVADVFAGSGAMGFEALSRGAEHVIFLDTNAAALRSIDKNAEQLEADTSVTVQYRDAVNPGPAPHRCDLVFFDAPYRSGLNADALEAMSKDGWFADGAIIVCELGGTEDLDTPDGFEVLNTRRYRSTKIIYLQYRVGARD